MKGVRRDRGFPYKGIANCLGIAPGTVRTHIARIYDKLQRRSANGAAHTSLGQRPRSRPETCQRAESPFHGFASSPMG